MKASCAAVVVSIAGVVLLCCGGESKETAALQADAGASVEEDAEADAGTDAGRVKGCPGETPETYPWQPPVPKVTSACSESDLSKLATAIAQKTLTAADDIAAALGPSCAACAIGGVSDTTWRAVLSGHEGYIGNVGGCAVHLGASEICGQSIDRLSTCLIVGCAGCANRKEQDTCADALTTVDGACAAPLKTMREKCPAKTLVSAFDANGVCQSFVETIRLFCGPPAQDGG